MSVRGTDFRSPLFYPHIKMLIIKNSIFVKSIMDLRDRPAPSLPEFTFAGRSNVGKSSLINSLLNRKNFARVSKAPGKTRSINYYLINELFYFVDLPGYGYAKVSKTEKKKWQTAIEKYILKNEQIRIIFILIDGLVGPQENDLQLIEWFKYNKIGFMIIVTKIDRINNNRRVQLKNTLVKNLELDERTRVILFSAKTLQGKEEILNNIDHMLR